jgi:hypothetical protein
MAKAKKEIRSLYPTLHEFREAQENALNKSALLYNMAITLHDHFADKFPAEITEMLKKAIDEYQQAFYGDQ